MSRFPNPFHRNKITRDHDQSIAQVQQARGELEHDVAKQSQAHEHSAAAAISGTQATLDSSSTRTPVVAVVLPQRTARA